MKMKPATQDTIVALVIFLIAATLPVGVLLTMVHAYDVLPTVDTAREAARTTQSEVYRFGNVTDSPVSYSDGTIVPSRTFSIEALNHTTGKYEVLGYINIHGHKVKVDSTDDYDISIGSTIRFNPKN